MPDERLSFSAPSSGERSDRDASGSLASRGRTAWTRSPWPLPIAVFAVVALILSLVQRIDAQADRAEPSVPIAFVAVPDTGLDIAAAERATADASGQRPDASGQRLRFRTAMAENPFWVRFALPSLAVPRPLVVFPSRHARSVTCWQVGLAAEPLLDGRRPFDEPPLRPALAGFALDYPGPPGTELLCRLSFVGPATLTIEARSTDALAGAVRRDTFACGLLTGSLAALAVFMAFVGAVNRERAFALFAGWLVANWAMAAMSVGWDSQWLERVLPEAAVFPARKLGFAAYFTLNTALFTGLFPQEIRASGAARVAPLLWLGTGVVIVAAVALPYRWFLPVMWALAGGSTLVGFWILARILRINRSRGAAWYALAWTVPLLGALGEMLTAIAGLRVPFVEPVAGTALSSLLVALSFGERLRSEREGRARARRQTTQVLERLYHLAEHDPLTDLANRRGLERMLDQALETLAADGPLSVAYLDLDRFKLVNDLFGHSVGDQVLVQVAARLRAALPATAMLARVGGDEFVLLLRSVAAPDAVALARRLLDSLQDEPFRVGASAFSVAGSLGLVTLSSPIEREQLLSACDHACLEAKQAGGQRMVARSLGDDGLARHFEETRFAAALRQRLPVERMSLELQPIVSLARPEASLAYEALVRLRAEDGRAVPAPRLIAAAERNGLMPQLDRWVISRMLDWLEAHPAHLERVDFAAINLSGASLNDERFIADVLAMLAAHPRAARRLCFEVTESVALYDLRHTRRVVERIRALGSRTALDDFGAGYTSFSYLKELPADLLKIDGGYVRQLEAQPADRAIVQAVVELAHRLGVQVVAEWAERPETVALLVAMGVEYGQGWALARPMAPERLRDAASGAELVADPGVLALLGRGRGGEDPLPVTGVAGSGGSGSGAGGGVDVGLDVGVA